MRNEQAARSFFSSRPNGQAACRTLKNGTLLRFFRNAPDAFTVQRAYCDGSIGETLAEGTLSDCLRFVRQSVCGEWY